MALVDPNLHRHILKHRHGFAVTYPDLDDEVRWKEAMAFCESPDTIGTFDWLVGIVSDDNTGEFYFSDENTAFAFKMRFG